MKNEKIIKEITASSDADEMEKIRDWLNEIKNYNDEVNVKLIVHRVDGNYDAVFNMNIDWIRHIFSITLAPIEVNEKC